MCMKETLTEQLLHLSIHFTGYTLDPVNDDLVYYRTVINSAGI